MLRITSVQEGELHRLVIDGELAMESMEEFKRAVSQVPSDSQTIQLDCGALTFLDSTGVNALLQAVAGWKNENRSVSLVNVLDEVHEMLDILGFFEVLAG